MQTETRIIAAARKAHMCSWCGEKIEAGQPYKSYRWFGDDVATVKEHPECYEAMMNAVAFLREPIEFAPGDFPRGCWCDFDEDCKTCGSAIEATESGDTHA